MRNSDRGIAKLADQFTTRDPPLPELRDILDKGNEQLADLHQQAEKCCGPVVLEEPTEDEVAFVRRVVTKEVWEAQGSGRLAVSGRALSDAVWLLWSEASWRVDGARDVRDTYFAESIPGLMARVGGRGSLGQAAAGGRSVRSALPSSASIASPSIGRAK